VIAVLGSAIGLGLGLFFAWSIGKALEEVGFTTYEVPYVGVAAVVGAELIGVAQHDGS
jgi:hypothetical protein